MFKKIITNIIVRIVETIMIMKITRPPIFSRKSSNFSKHSGFPESKLVIPSIHFIGQLALV